MSGHGVITTVTPLTVTLDSGDAALPAQKLVSYATPVVGDRVAWLRLPSGLLILGKV